MNVLVTGACGYLGSALCPSLEKKGHQVRRFDKVLSNDITEISQVQKAGEGVDLIIHLAAIVGLHDVSKDIELARRVNVDGTANVCSLGLRTIFGGVLGGYPEGSDIDELTPVTPETPYYQQKLVAEKLVLGKRADNISLRFGTMYGVSPVMRWNLLVHDFVRRALENGKISLFQPFAVRPITNVRDAIRAILFFMTGDKGGIYNIVSSNFTKIEIARAIQEVTKCKITFIEGNDPERRDYTASSAKVEALGFSPSHDLVNAAKEIVFSFAGGMYINDSRRAGPI